MQEAMDPNFELRESSPKGRAGPFPGTEVKRAMTFLSLIKTGDI